jgi:hypothetical protein
LLQWLLLLLAAVVLWGIRRQRMAAFKSAAALLLCLHLLVTSESILLLLLQGFLRAPRRRPLPGARASVQETFMVRVQGVQSTTASLMVFVHAAATMAVIQAFLKDTVVII